MTGAEGQASRRGTARITPWLRRAASLALASVLVLALALGGLAWRLAEGPLELPFLARQIEAGFDSRADGARLRIGSAAVAWDGFRGGTAAPLDIRLSNTRLLGADGAIQAVLPEAAITLSARALLRGTLAPATIELRGPQVVALLAPDGSIRLSPDRGGAPEAPAAAGPDPLALLADLMRPASDRDGYAALRRLQVIGGAFTLLEPATGRRWALVDPQIDIRRAATGGLAGEGEAMFEAAGLAVPVRLNAAADGTPMRLTAGMSLPALRPAELATAWPPLAPLALLDAPVSLSAFAEFDAAARPERVWAQLAAGAGSFDLGRGAAGEARRLPFASLAVTADVTGRALNLREARLVLPGADPAMPGPALTVTGEVLHRDANWQVALDLAAEPIEAAELPRLWPVALAPEARAAALAALPVGLLRDLRLRTRFGMPEALDGFSLEQAQVSLAAERAVVDLGPGRRIAADSAEFAISATPDHLRLERAVLRLPAASGPAGPAAGTPTIRAEGGAERAEGLWRGWLGIGLDALSFADLPAYWPPGIGHGGEREWITGNITAGEIRNGAWRIEGEAPAGRPEAVRVTAVSGTAEAHGAEIHWLRPVPPALNVSGTAEFSLNEIILRTGGGRQAATEDRRTMLDLRGGEVRLFNLDGGVPTADIALQVAGPLPGAVTLLKHPRLRLFARRPLPFQPTEGQAEARIGLVIPLLANVPVEDIRINASARVTEARLPGVLLDQDLDRAAFELAVDTDGLRASGQALLLGSPVQLGVEIDFRRGPATQVVERATLVGRLDARQIAILGFDATRALDGPVALDARLEKRRNGTGQVVLRGDLREARLGVPALGWTKPPGTPGTADATLRLQGDALAEVERFQVEALELSLRGRASFGRRSRLERVEITESLFGGSRFTGEAQPPARDGAPWTLGLRGPLFDLRPVLGPPGHAEGGAARQPPPSSTGDDGAALLLDLRFDRVTMGRDRNLSGVQARTLIDGRGVMRGAQAIGRTAPPGQPGAFEFNLDPQGRQRQLRLVAEDGGALLRAFDLVNSIEGGRLTVNGSYAEMRPGAALTGTAELDQFVLRDAPAAAKLLQAMTLYGLVDAARGGSGLVFNRLVAPFTLTPEALTLADARAFSASLGLTAKGRILREQGVVDMEGTIVPAYVFNTLLGNLPIIGRLFSPEAGGGLFAATYRIQGPLADPQVAVNPLAALTPGFLRGLFGPFDQEPGTPPR